MRRNTQPEEVPRFRYVAGFMFSPDRSQIALIRKTKPEWQAGRLNGIGGKIEPGEEPFDAMVREFEEETGYRSSTHLWSYYHRMSGTNDDGSSFSVDFFASLGRLELLKTTTEEEVVLVSTESIHPLRIDMMENLPWLIGMAVDHLDDHRPQYVESHYSSHPETGLQLLEDRDRAEDFADELSRAIGNFCNVDIGEHTSANDPWQNALDAIRKDQ